jgi:hypothetical protein
MGGSNLHPIMQAALAPFIPPAERVVTEFNQPWGEPRRTERLWTHVGPPGLRGKSIRNDALWEAIKTDRLTLIPLAQAYREAAVADGWSVRPTYDGHEAVERAATLERDGWVMHIIARTPRDDTELPSASVCIWAPDKAQIRPPLTYDFAAMVAATKVCIACKSEGVETRRLAFASRVCAACEDDYRRTHMGPGWCE